MKKRVSSSDGEPSAVTLSDFYEAGRDRLQLSIVAGAENLAIVLPEPMSNRPGLALTGFFECFAHKRLQLFGNAEFAYLNSLTNDERRQRIAALIEHGALAYVCTAGHKPRPDIVRIVSRAGGVVFSTPLKTRIFAHQAAFVLERIYAPRTSIYGTMVEVCGLGVLFEGAPGLGKSETALGLIKRGYALVADDLTQVRKDVTTGLLFGSASESTAGYMEIRGIGIMHIQSIFGIGAIRGEKRLQLVITLKRLEEIEGEIDRVGQTRRTRQILGVDVPNIIIPVSEGRDLVNLVETAAQQQKLLLTGVNPVEELSERIRRRAEKKEAHQHGRQ